MLRLRRSRLALVLALALAGGCHPRAADRTQPTTASTAVDFATLAAEVLDRHLEAHPERAVELGLHAYDGRLRDVSAAGLAREGERLARDIAALDGLDPATLEPMQRVERATLLAALRDELFRIEVSRAPWTNPMSYLGALDLTPYVSRAYAPASTRAQAVVALAEAVPGYLQHARANLQPQLARTFIDTALLQVRGTASFARTDVPAALKDLPADERTRLVAALETMAKALDAFAEHLEQARARATDDFALGAADFTRMLAETQGIDIELAQLRRVLEADLERNLAAMRAAAAQIDPKASVAEVVARVADERPAASAVLKTAAEQA
ncbi:MAG TPA: DUF885 family protein, partial [Nannocystaceae bacterium]|nr:DUF885 family protein [Nannocystaceae bacterium]